jgi:hypothetical protein
MIKKDIISNLVIGPKRVKPGSGGLNSFFEILKISSGIIRGLLLGISWGLTIF